MKGLRKKLKDQSGASILLALLFFLLCSMVGASVLMAAMSNAGKASSNRKEQQKYLLLSSALRLVCDELTTAKYSGQYGYECVLVPKKDEAGETLYLYDEDGQMLKDEDGNPIPVPSYYECRYKQIAGEFDCMDGVLPLINELDRIFASAFKGPDKGTRDDGVECSNTYEPKSGSLISATHVLTVDASEVLDGSEKVTVKVQMEPMTLTIWLTATLKEGEGDDYIYTMEAELIANRSGGWDFKGTEHENKVELVDGWTLKWIAKKVAGE